MAIKQFCDLQFSDAFMFAAAMEDEELCCQVLERILEIPIAKVRVRSERTLFVNSDYRGVRLDVYADDEENTMYDVEMQTESHKNLPMRSRVYQSRMDLAALKPGERFENLPRSFIIFICTNDPFGDGKYRYTCQMLCRETGKVLEDGAYRIFLNAEGNNADEEPEELVRFLRYVKDAECAEEEDRLIERIESRITDLKQNREVEVRYMLFGEMLDDERREGREEGKKEGRKEERTLLFRLMDLMESGGEGDQIPLLRKDPEFLERMFHKYHLGA